MNKEKNTSKIIKNKLSYIKQNFINLEDNEKIMKPVILQNIIKPRDPGIELGRILAMYGIVIHHILVHGHAFKKYLQYKGLYKLNISFYWHVNTFIFISGYAGYKTTKYSNLLYLWFCVIFYSIGIIKYFSIYKPHIYKSQIKIIDFFPVITEKYWYFSEYFGMYLFLPVFNKGLENINKPRLKIMIITLIGVYIILLDLFCGLVFNILFNWGLFRKI